MILATGDIYLSGASLIVDDTLHASGEVGSWVIMSAAGDITGSLGSITDGYAVKVVGKTLVLSDLAHGDANGDGSVDLQDFDLLKANLIVGGASVPEPATLSLIAIAGIGLLKRCNRK